MSIVTECAIMPCSLAKYIRVLVYAYTNVRQLCERTCDNSASVGHSSCVKKDAVSMQLH